MGLIYPMKNWLTIADLFVNLLITLIVKCEVIPTLDLSSATKKVKIELEDENGQKYNLTLQGSLTKEKIMNVIEFVQLFEKNSTQTQKEFEHKENDERCDNHEQ